MIPQNPYDLRQAVNAIAARQAQDTIPVYGTTGYSEGNAPQPYIRRADMESILTPQPAPAPAAPPAPRGPAIDPRVAEQFARDRAALGMPGQGQGGVPGAGFNPAMLGILQQVMAMQQAQQQPRPPIQAPQPPGPQQVQFNIPRLPTTQQNPNGSWSRILGGV